MQCLVSVIPLSISVHGLPRRARNFFLGCTGILANVQGKIGALYRDMTQIGWQVCSIVVCVCVSRSMSHYLQKSQDK